MQTEIFQMSVEAVGTDDGRNTYEIRRKWGDRGKKSLVVELYPTLSPAMLLSVKLDAPVLCRLDAPELDFACCASADCLHQHLQVI